MVPAAYDARHVSFSVNHSYSRQISVVQQPAESRGFLLPVAKNTTTSKIIDTVVGTKLAVVATANLVYTPASETFSVNLPTRKDSLSSTVAVFLLPHSLPWEV